MRDHIAFFRQFRKRFETTGSIVPSSRFLAAAMTRPLLQRSGPVRVLEVGPGTGAVTQRIVRIIRPGDRLDLVELNETFVGMLQERFQDDAAWRRAAGQSELHVCPVQDFRSDAPYDFVISGLPLNNFSSGLVQELFETIFGLLAPGGILSYFEYMYVRPTRRFFSNADERKRLSELDTIANAWFDRYRIRRDSVLLNLPPAWVQHLQKRT